MIEFITANVAELLMSAVFLMLTVFTGAIKMIYSSFKADMIERKQMWELEMQKINTILTSLEADHKDIMRHQAEAAEKVSSLERQHADHEKDQSVQLEILRDLKSKSDQRRGLFG